MRTLTVTASLMRSAVIMAIGVAPFAAVAGPCDEADHLLEVGHILEAEQRYGDLVKETEGAPPHGCARQGLMRAAGARCEAAERLMRSDNADQANKAYEAVLEKFPTSECALAGIERIANRARTSARSCEAADKLAERRLDAEAKDAYKKILDAAPGTACAIAGLEGLGGPYALRWARRAVDEFGATALLLFAEVAGLLLAILLFARWVRLSHPLQLKLDMERVSAGGSGLDAGPCEQILSLIDHELEHLARRPQFTSATVIDGPVEVPSLPDLSAVSKGTNVLWNAFVALIPARTVSLSAVLLDSSGGNGILLRLVYQPTKELWGSLVLTDDDPCASNANSAGAGQTGSDGDCASLDAKTVAAAGYARLAHAAAAWACWTIHERTSHTRRFRGKSCVEAGCTEMRRAFGTARWRSYWKAAQGASDRKRNPAGAKRALREALVRDPANRLALYNFAALEVADRAPDLEHDENLYKRLRGYFEAARVCPDDEGRRQLNGSARFDALRMFSDFYLGGIAFYRQFAFDASTKAAQALLNEAANRFLLAEEMACASPEQASEVVLDTRIPRATCLRMLGRGAEAQTLLGSCESDVLAETSLLNLACFYSNPGSGPGSDSDMKKANAFLDQALEADPSIERWARRDPALRRLWQHRELLNEPRALREAVSSD